MNNIYSIKNEGKKVELKIYGDIESNYWKRDDDESVTSVKDLEKALKDAKDANLIEVYINSVGGSVFEGIAIYNILKRHKAYKKVVIDGFACSIASVIAMAGNAIHMSESSCMMIHQPWTICLGNAKELRKMADDLEKMSEVIVPAYMSKFKGTEKELTKLMDAESYLTAKECYEKGLCTKLIDDSESTREDVESAFDKEIGLFSNKLNQLEAIKNAISDLHDDEEEITEVEESKEAEEVEDSAETEVVKEPESDVVTDSEAQDEKPKEIVNEDSVKKNALAAFFNLR